MANARSHILIVDDEEDIRGLLKATLEAQGHVCHSASSGQEAIEILSSVDVDLALIDIIMPVMSGLSLFKYIREYFPDVAIVFVTNVHDMNLAFDLIKDGAYDYLVKSRIQHGLVQSVERSLKERSARLGETLGRASK